MAPGSTRSFCFRAGGNEGTVLPFNWELRAVPFSEKAVLALLSLSKESRIFRRFAECRKDGITPQEVVSTKSAFDG
jgi:hypothetical protein